MAKGVKVVSVGPLRARITQLKTGKFEGRWKIRYHDASGTGQTGGVSKELEKAVSRAEEILKALIVEDVGTLSREEISVIQYIRDGSVTIDDIYHLRASRKQRADTLIGDAVDDFLKREITGAEYSTEQEADYRRVLNELRRVFAAKYVWQIILTDLEKWATTWNVGGKRYNNKRVILSKFWDWATARDLCLGFIK